MRAMKQLLFLRQAPRPGRSLYEQPARYRALLDILTDMGALNA